MSEYRDRDHIKSYVKRATRMSASQRRALEQFQNVYCVPFQEEPVDPGSLFDEPRARVILEIGFGMGDATAELARKMGDTGFVGVEVHRPGVGKLLGLLHRDSIANVKIINHDAIAVLERMIPAGSLDGVHLFFPDPWPKKRHHKRRLVRPAVTELISQRLKPGGYVYMVTDWEEYALAAMDVLRRTPLLENEYDGFAEPQPWRPTTAFEKKGTAAGRPIRELLFRRLSGG